ncbi:unnamed protein product, partial [Meganyctiphanes norvegica]
ERIQFPCAFLPTLTWMTVGEEHSIASPGFPSNYPPNSNCGWKFRSNNPDVRIHVKCSSFLVGRRKSCSRMVDRLMFMEEIKVTKCCGNHPGVEFVSEANMLDIRFISTLRRSYSGFYCSVLASTDTSK